MLEERLAGQEQDGLEKELLYEQVCRLADRAQTRVTAHRDSTLQACLSPVPYTLQFLCNVCVQVAQRVNLYQSKIKDATHKTMALVSELTMQQVLPVLHGSCGSNYVHVSFLRQMPFGSSMKCKRERLQ